MKPFVLFVTWIAVGQPATTSQIEMDTEQACLIAREELRNDFYRYKKDSTQLFAACLRRSNPDNPKTSQ